MLGLQFILTLSVPFWSQPVYNQSFLCLHSIFIGSLSNSWVYWKVTIVICLICYFIFAQNHGLWAFLTNVSNRPLTSVPWLGLVSYLFYRFFYIALGHQIAIRLKKQSLSKPNSIIPIPSSSYHFSGLMSLFRTFLLVFTYRHSFTSFIDSFQV